MSDYLYQFKVQIYGSTPVAVVAATPVAVVAATAAAGRYRGGWGAVTLLRRLPGRSAAEDATRGRGCAAISL